MEEDRTPTPIPATASMTTPDEDMIPCEVCHHSVPFATYADHLEACAQRHHFQTNYQSFFNIPQPIVMNQAMPPRPTASGISSANTPLNNMDWINNVVGRFLYQHPPTIASSIMNMLDTGVQARRRLILPPPSASEYEFNLWLQDLMGGDVQQGVADLERAAPLIEKESVPADMICTICQDTLQTLDVPLRRTAQCSHYFCDPCIRKWLETKRSCPNCFADLNQIPPSVEQNNEEDEEQMTAREREEESKSPEPASSAHSAANEFRSIFYLDRYRVPPLVRHPSRPTPPPLAASSHPQESSSSRGPFQSPVNRTIRRPPPISTTTATSALTSTTAPITSFINLFNEIEAEEQENDMDITVNLTLHTHHPLRLRRPRLQQPSAHTPPPSSNSNPDINPPH